MQASVFVGVSVDGFLARRDGAVDFLPEDPEPHGFDEFYASVDAVVIGRRTFEWVVNYGGWLYGTKRVVALSSRPLDLSEVRGRAQACNWSKCRVTQPRLLQSWRQAAYATHMWTVERRFSGFCARG